MAKGTRPVRGTLKGTPIKDIGATIQRTKDGKVTKNSPSIVDGIKPVKKTYKEGYHTIPPEHLLDILVPRLEVSDGLIHGFQRPDITKPHVRRIAEAMENEIPMPAVEIGIYRNALWTVDGQHRILGAVSSRHSIPALVRKMNAEQMNELFSNQGKNRKINPSNIVMTATDDYSLYVQDAITSPSVKDNPWYGLVSEAMTSSNKITAKQMMDIVTRYVSGSLQEHPTRIIGVHEFNRDLADQAAVLIRTFGTKQTNYFAFRPLALRALAYAAVTIIRRQGSRSADINRWVSWMPKFPWENYMGVRRSKELALFLIGHWNKNLNQENKILLPQEVM